MLKLYGPHIYWSTNSEDNTPKSRRARRGILLLGRVELSDQQWLVSVCQWDNRVGRFNESIILLIVGRRGASGERGTSSVGNKWRISKEHGTWRCFQRLCKFSETERVVIVDLFWFDLEKLRRIAGSARLTLTKIRVIWWRQATMTPFVSTMLLPLRELLIYIYIYIFPNFNFGLVLNEYVII